MTYKEKLAEENDVRLNAFANAPYPFFGGRYWVRLLTPRDLAMLEIARSSVVLGGTHTRRDLFNLLAYLLGFTGRGYFWRRFGLRRFVMGLNLEQIGKEIEAYRLAVFQDRPLAASAENDNYTADRSPAHIIAFWASFFSSHYSMSYAEIMATPIPVLYQLRRVWLIGNGRGHEVFDESDSIRAREEIEAIAKETS